MQTKSNQESFYINDTMKKILQWMMAAILICGLPVFTSCSTDNDDIPVKTEYKGVPLVILDTDIGSSTDDLFAMEMLYQYQNEGRCKLLGVVVDRQRKSENTLR